MSSLNVVILLYALPEYIIFNSLNLLYFLGKESKTSLTIIYQVVSKQTATL